MRQLSLEEYSRIHREKRRQRKSHPNAINCANNLMGYCTDVVYNCRDNIGLKCLTTKDERATLCLYC